MQKVNSLDHALEVLGLSTHFNLMPEALKTIGLPAAHIAPLIAHYQITLIIEANNVLNKWAPDWSNSNQYKYNVYQRVEKDTAKPSGFGFSCTGCDGWFTGTAVGSRLLVGTYEEAIYIGTDFKDLFETAWLIINDINNEQNN